MIETAARAPALKSTAHIRSKKRDTLNEREREKKKQQTFVGIYQTNQIVRLQVI